MKFKRILKRNVYPTWTSSRCIKGYKVYIYYIPDIRCYHFQIDRNGDIVYISLNDNIRFDNFGECCLVAEKWVKKKGN